MRRLYVNKGAIVIIQRVTRTAAFIKIISTLVKSAVRCMHSVVNKGRR